MVSAAKDGRRVAILVDPLWGDVELRNTPYEAKDEIKEIAKRHGFIPTWDSVLRAWRLKNPGYRVGPLLEELRALFPEARVRGGPYRGPRVIILRAPGGISVRGQTRPLKETIKELAKREGLRARWRGTYGEWWIAGATDEFTSKLKAKLEEEGAIVEVK